MANFKTKILNSLKNNKNTDNTLNYLSNIQNNLIKNYSNHVFSNQSKNKLLEKYCKIKNIGEMIYRHNALRQNNLNYANEEENVSNLVLKGGISNCKYVWHSENSENTCEECAALDGTEYSFEDEVPERPHPNCQCWVEIIENDDENTDTDEEPCDCWERIDNLIAELECGTSEIENATTEAENDIEEFTEMESSAEQLITNINETLEDLSEEYGQHMSDCENNIDLVYGELLIKVENLQNILARIVDAIDVIRAHITVFAIFSYNYAALLTEAYVLKEAGMDKYRHSVANCQAAQLGELEEQAAVELSNFKEEYDQYKNSYARTHKVSIEEALADSERDQLANRLGKERGRNNPTCDCRILMQDLKPIQNNKKWW